MPPSECPGCGGKKDARSKQCRHCRAPKGTLICPSCGKNKDIRATVCQQCTWKVHKHPKLGTAQDWYKGPLGYMIGCINGKRYYQHRFVMEQSLGRELSRTEHVHHINGDKTDNRLENLELLNKSDHHKQHASPEHMKTMSVLGHQARWGKASKS